MNKQNLNRYVYQGEDKIIYHAINHNCDITARWSGGHYYFIKATKCDTIFKSVGKCELPEFPYRLSRYDRQRLELREI